MIEYLAIPAWKPRPVSLQMWADKLTELGGPVVVTRDGSSGAWLEVASLRLRGYVLIHNGKASAVNFEMHDPDPSLQVIEAAAKDLNWEIHADDENCDEDDEDDEDDD